MKFIIVDVDKQHAFNLWRRICLPNGCYPDIFIIENRAGSIVEFIEGLKQHCIAMPFAFRVDTFVQTENLLIVHEKSKIISKNQIQVKAVPASSRVISTFVNQWGFYYECREVYKTRFMVIPTESCS